MEFFTFCFLSLEVTSRWSVMFLPSSGAPETILKYLGLLWSLMIFCRFRTRTDKKNCLVFNLGRVGRWERLDSHLKIWHGTGEINNWSCPRSGIELAVKAEDVSWAVKSPGELCVFCRHTERRECCGSALLAHSCAAHPAWAQCEGKGREVELPHMLGSTQKSSAKAWQRNSVLLQTRVGRGFSDIQRAPF